MEWISVKDRLPEYGEMVLAEMTYGQPSHLVVALEAITREGAAWGEFRDGKTGALTHINCVARWMYIPD